MKIKRLYIDNYKMFKKFDINFTDKDNNALPIIVIAGVNGSGKTTLLDFVIEYFRYKKNELVAELQGKSYGLGGYSFGAFIETTSIDKSSSIQDIAFKDTESDHIVYFSSGTDSIDDIKESILEHYRRLSRKYSHIETLNKFQNFLDTIFTDDMEITFTIEDIDIVLRDDEKVIFKNSRGDTFDIDKLSTGEKTLLSKVLKLYFKNYKNKVILIDEPELSLHPSWQNRVLRIYENFAKENNCQIIIATHSPYIIGSAKNEYIRVLHNNEDNEIEVINNIIAYGRDIEWVLKEMGLENTRPSYILDKIKKSQKFIDDKKYNEAEKQIDSLENIIGSYDSEILKLRNDLFFERAEFEEDS